MPTPKQDCELLMREMLPLAKQMLADHGEFYPYGGMMRADREIVHVGAQEAGNDHPPSQPLIQTLQDYFRDQARSGGIIASCIIFDVLIKKPDGDQKRDAIQVNLDHRDDYSVEVVFPYQLGQNSISLEDPFAQVGNAQIFTKTPA